MQVDDEVVVRRVGEHAGLEVHRRPAAVGEVALGEIPQQLLVVVVRLAVEGLGVDDLFEVVVLPELEARDAVHREAVEAPLVNEQVEDGEVLGPEPFGAGGLEPGEDLPLGDGEAAQHVDELSVPGACGDDELVRLVGAAVGSDPHPALQRLPFEDPLAGVDLGPVRLRRRHVRDDALLRRQEPAVRLHESQVVVGQAVAGVAAVQLGSGQNLVGQVVQLARFPGALEDPGVLGARVHGPGGVEQSLVCRILDLAPQLVGAPEQQHV